MNKLFLLITMILMAIAVPIEASEQNILKSPYPVFITPPNKLSLSADEKKCPKTPTPIHKMEYTSIYTDKSNGISIVDKDAQKKYRKQIKIIKKYETQIYKWSEQIFNKSSTHNHALPCSLKWLTDWAAENSMLDGKTNFQGEAVRKWTLASLSSFYLQIKNIENINPEQKIEIENWLERLGKQVILDYTKNPNSKSRNNNHMYWAAWSVMVTGVATNNNGFYEWGLNQYKKAIEDIQEDGTLPLETYRQSKAFLYHIFAAAPLVIMAETMTRNGEDMYEYDDGAIHRLIELILKELDNKQVYLKEKTGIKQNLTGAITPKTLAWLEVYNSRFKNSNIEELLSTFRPMEQRRIGGNMTRLFSSETIIQETDTQKP